MVRIIFRVGGDAFHGSHSVTAHTIQCSRLEFSAAGPQASNCVVTFAVRFKGFNCSLAYMKLAVRVHKFMGRRQRSGCISVVISRPRFRNSTALEFIEPKSRSRSSSPVFDAEHRVALRV